MIQNVFVFVTIGHCTTLYMAILMCGVSTQRDTGRYGPPVYPKRHPGQHHHQHGGKVSLKHEEEDMPPENEVYVEPIVPT